MKIAFHFDEYRLQGGDKAITAVLTAARSASKYAHTKIFTGTLLFDHAATETSHDGDQVVGRVDMDRRAALIAEWVLPQPLRWHALQPTAAETALQGKVFAVCLETIDATMASSIDAAMRREFRDSYIGAIEVDESVASHLNVYLLCAFGRINGGAGAVFWDGIDADSKMPYRLDWFKRAAFDPVTFESLEGRYTIFDRDHGAKQSHRNALGRQWMRELFDSVIDHAIPRLADGAPEIPEKLWSALRAFRDIEVDEQASHVALTCRRIFENVADSLFPPTDAAPDGRKLGTDKYKNRLLKYLEEQQVGQTEQKLIVATMDASAAELDNLYVLTNKGLHSEFDWMQARRCLLRTILLLDELVAVRQTPLATRVRHDTDLIRKMVERSPDKIEK